MTLHLMSHALCPYVQRAVISLHEKGVAFERTFIDLADKPDWFLAISPLGKTPVLTVDGRPVFESVAILEYLEDTQPNPLHPADPLARAQHRAWIEFGSAILNDIAGFYCAADARALSGKAAAMAAKFARLEDALGTGPYFAGADFSLVDAVFGPVFRYFDSFDTIADFGVLRGKPKVRRWRTALANRASVRAAVSPDYPERLRGFLLKRHSHLTTILTGAADTGEVTGS